MPGSPWNMRAQQGRSSQASSQSGSTLVTGNKTPEPISGNAKSDEYAWHTVKSNKNVSRGGTRGGQGYRRSTSDQLHNKGDTGHGRGSRRGWSEGSRGYDRRRSGGQTDKSGVRGRKS